MFKHFLSTKHAKKSFIMFQFRLDSEETFFSSLSMDVSEIQHGVETNILHYKFDQINHAFSVKMF